MWFNYQQKINFTVLDNNYPSRKVYTLNILTLTGTAELFLGEDDYYPEIDGNYVNEISPDKAPIKINNIGEDVDCPKIHINTEIHNANIKTNTPTPTVPVSEDFIESCVYVWQFINENKKDKIKMNW